MTDAQPQGDSQVELLRREIAVLAKEARAQANSLRRYQQLWNVVDVLTGVPAAALAAVSGVTGLASTTGRVPAAVLALTAAALAATATFLRSRTRYESNRRQCRAWRALEWDARAAYAYHVGPAADDLYAVLRELLESRRAILNNDFDTVLGKPRQLP